MKTELDADVRAKFDAVLARVKEPQSELSLSELGLVPKLTYSPSSKTITALLDTSAPPYSCPACSAVNGLVRETLARDLAAALQAEFPGWTIKIA